MRLVLTITNGANGLSGDKASRAFDQNGGTVGRGSDNAWILPDPQRVMSRQHLSISFENGFFWLTDTSVNGVFHNGAAAPLGRNGRVSLRAGDQVRFGDYTATVHVTGDHPAMPAAIGGGGASETFTAILSGGKGKPAEGPFTAALDHHLDPPPPPSPPARATPAAPPLPPRPAFETARELWGDSGDDSLFGGVAATTPQDRGTPANHVPAEHEIFRPPNLHDLAPPAPSPAPAATADALALPDDFGQLDWSLDAPKPSTAPKTLTPAPVSAPAPAVAPAPSEPTPSPVPPSGPGDDLAWRALFDGMGIDPDTAGLSPSPELFRAAGHILRQTITGLRELLQARAAIKNEMHLERTVMAASGNNPLKYCVTDEDVARALLGPHKRGYLNGPEAIRDGFQDLKNHELGMVAGVKESLTGLLAHLDPEAFRRRLPAEKSLLGGNKAKAWDAYCAFYAHFTEDCRDDVMRVLARDFSDAYKGNDDEAD